MWFCLCKTDYLSAGERSNEFWPNTTYIALLCDLHVVLQYCTCCSNWSSPPGNDSIPEEYGLYSGQLVGVASRRGQVMGMTSDGHTYSHSSTGGYNSEVHLTPHTKSSHLTPTHHTSHTSHLITPHTSLHAESTLHSVGSLGSLPAGLPGLPCSDIHQDIT